MPNGISGSDNCIEGIENGLGGRIIIVAADET
jgi:hypothetical protein